MKWVENRITYDNLEHFLNSLFCFTFPLMSLFNKFLTAACVD